MCRSNLFYIQSLLPHHSLLSPLLPLLLLLPFTFSQLLQSADMAPTTLSCGYICLSCVASLTCSRTAFLDCPSLQLAVLQVRCYPLLCRSSVPGTFLTSQVHNSTIASRATHVAAWGAPDTMAADDWVPLLIEVCFARTVFWYLFYFECF